MQTTSHQPSATAGPTSPLATSRTSARQALHVQQVAIAGGDHMLLQGVASLQGLKKAGQGKGTGGGGGWLGLGVETHHFSVRCPNRQGDSCSSVWA
jgi:hypothetical protein